jgi:cell wall-associated NlpC family hydrolase
VAVTDVLVRIAEIQALVQRVAAPSSSPTSGSFDQVLAGEIAPQADPAGRAAASVWSGLPVTPAAGGQSRGLAALAWAASEVGQAESPPGSNDSPRIALYRTAVAGAVPGTPWCAYFVSWAAAQAGTRLGFAGEGLGSVEGIEAWARATGRLLPPGTPPQPGDLVLYGGNHVGIVEAVNPDGSLVTVEGNHNDRVDRVRRAASEPTGFVRL